MSLFYWPISGPAFLVVYAAGLAVLLAAVYVTRRPANGEAPAVRSDKLDCYDLALLNGGEELAVTVALANLGAAGALDLGQGQIRKLAESNGLDMSRLRKSDVERLGVTSYARPTVTIDPAVMHPVERCVYETVALSGSGSPAALRSAAAAMAPLRAARTRLENLGLLRDEEDRSRLARWWRWFLPLMVLGIIRLIVGISRGRPMLFLLAFLVATVVAMVMTARVARTTARGRQVLDDLRAREPLPADRSSIGPAALGPAIALFGASLLWNADPGLAAALEVPAKSSAGGWGGSGGCSGCSGDSGGCGGGCGGCGGCGG